MNYISEKEQVVINNFFNNVFIDPDWAENIYQDDDDPYSEPLISFFRLCCDSKYVNLLDIIIEKTPVHKTNVINAYLYSNAVQLYAEQEHWTGLLEANKKFTRHCDNNIHLKALYLYLFTNHKAEQLSFIEKYFDKDFTIGKSLSEEYKVFIEKFLLYQHLDTDSIVDSITELNTKKNKL